MAEKLIGRKNYFVGELKRDFGAVGQFYVANQRRFGARRITPDSKILDADTSDAHNTVVEVDARPKCAQRSVDKNVRTGDLNREQISLDAVPLLMNESNQNC